MNKRYAIAAPTTLFASTTIASVRWEPEPDLDDGEGTPDWLAFIFLLIVVLMVFGKIK
jgi:hypothetical protein